MGLASSQRLARRALGPLAIVFAFACEDYNCADLANCSVISADAGHGSSAHGNSSSPNTCGTACDGSELAPLPGETTSSPGGGPPASWGPAPTSSQDDRVTSSNHDGSDPHPPPSDQTTEPLVGAGSSSSGPASSELGADTSEGDDLTTELVETGPTASSTEETPTTDPPSSDVPDTPHCADVADWEPAWAQWEDAVLDLVNSARATGANCDSEGSFGATTPLAMDPTLRCSSRLHSLDMFVRDFFDHTNPDGLDPFDRMAEAGFSGGWMGENIAYGQQSPEEVMQAWLESDGHCSNIMNPNYTVIGVGYHPGGANWQEGQHFWTQNFGTPR